MALLLGICLLAASLTACIAKDDALRFIIIGDNGGRDRYPFTTYVQRTTARAMAKIADQEGGIDFVVELGDNFYENGVENVKDQKFQRTFEDVYTASALQVPWYIVAGNHDYYGNVSAQIAYTKLSTRWHYPDFFYEVSFKIPKTNDTVEILMLDTVILAGDLDKYDGPQPDEPDHPHDALAQWSWITKKLNTSRAKYLFTAGHYPIHSVGIHGSTKLLQDDLLPLLYSHRANGHFCGHDHNLQHLRETKGGVPLDFIVSGSASKMDNRVHHRHKVPEGVSRFYWVDPDAPGGFVLADATSERLQYTFYTAKGEVVYKTTTKPRNIH